MNSFRSLRTRAPAGLLAILLSQLVHPLAYGEDMGNSSPLDKRIRTAVYSPDQVYRLQAAVGRGAMIQFPQGETINDPQGLMASGDPTAWELGVNEAGSQVVIKPLSNKDPDTNWFITTNKHSYVIELKLGKKEDATYVLRFALPEIPKPVARIDEPVNPCKGWENRSWKMRGNKDLAPSEVWDNGTFTCFRFATNKPRPALYQVLPDGTETVVSTHNEQNVLVAHTVSSIYRLRLNGQVFELKTQLQPTAYNFKGTTTGEVRTLKDSRP